MTWGDSAKIPAVLIVEDEPLVRLSALKVIEDAGFRVIEAANADEAIRILENRSDIRVVFTDIHNAGLHGWSQTRSCRPRSLASHQDNCDLWPWSGKGAGPSGGRVFLCQTL
jgi:CheY-like chemotaxis protein